MPYIKVDIGTLSNASESFQSITSKMVQIKDDLSSVKNHLDWDIPSAVDIQRRIERINGSLEEYSTMLTKMRTFIENAKSKYVSSNSVSTQNAVVEGTYSGGGKSVSAGLLGSVSRQTFDLKSLGENAVKSFGPVGTTVSFLLSLPDLMGSSEDGLEKSLKSCGETVVAWLKFTDEHPWKNYALTNRFGHNWGTKNYIKNMTGLAKESSKPAASWGERFNKNFSSKLSETFVKFDSKTGAYKANKLGIAGVAIDLVASGYGNYKQVKAGEITADRAVVETVAEVGAGLILSTAAGALAAAVLPATATVATVAVASTAIVWAADGLTKLVTGGDKGLSEVVSEGVGWVYDKGKEMIFDTGQNLVSGFEKIKRGVGEISSGACKWVFGTG